MIITTNEPWRATFAHRADYGRLAKLEAATPGTQTKLTALEVPGDD